MAKVLISIDDGLLKQIDRMAKSQGLTRSGYIARLAEYDAVVASGRTATKTKRVLERLDALIANVSASDSTADVRADRDAR